MQTKALERQLSDTEKRLQEMVTASQRQTNIAQHEVQPATLRTVHLYLVFNRIRIHII